MKITGLHIVNFRSIRDAVIDFGELSSVSNTHYLVGENNAGKSNICAALRAFYDIKVKDFSSDMPFCKGAKLSYVDITFLVDGEERRQIIGNATVQVSSAGKFSIRRYLKTEGKLRVGGYYALPSTAGTEIKATDQKNIPEKYVEKTIGTLSYIPAMTSPIDQVKTSGESPLRSLLVSVLKDKSFAENIETIQKGLAGFKDAVERSSKKKGDFLREVNSRLDRDWGMGMCLDLQDVSAEKILKTQVQVVFHATDQDDTHPLETYGSGFQRSVANALIDVWASRKAKADDENSCADFKILIYEEPEAFLHPAQQDILADNLAKLGMQKNCQVIVTTHSSHFVVHALNNLRNIVYVSKRSGNTEIRKYCGKFDKKLIELDNEFNPQISGDRSKNENRSKLGVRMAAPKGVGIIDFNAVRQGRDAYFIRDWFSVEDAAVFFARSVLLVEGLTEKNLLTYLMSEVYADENNGRSRIGKRILDRKVAVIATGGKFKMSRYVAMLKEFGIPFVVMIDNDIEKYECETRKKGEEKGPMVIGSLDELAKRKHAHEVFNAWLEDVSRGQIVKVRPELETYLGVSKNSHKSLGILKKLQNGKVDVNKLNDLLKKVLRAIDVSLERCGNRVAGGGGSRSVRGSNCSRRHNNMN